jgi:carboxypeptidase Taq
MTLAYEKLQARFRQISNLSNARDILSWDEAVMMPEGSGPSRNDSLADLSTLIQGLSVSPEIGLWLEAAESDDASLSSWDRANLREMKRVYVENTAIPMDLTQKLVRARLKGEQMWRALRPQNDWPALLPIFREVLNLTREMLAILGEKTGLSLYDAALSQFCNGLTTDAIEPLFGEIENFLPSLIQQVVEKQKREKALVSEGTFPMAAQKRLALEIVRDLGFSFQQGRLDESHHPFCGGHPRDIRMTTRYDEHDFLSALYGVVHETGHALYDQHLPQDWISQPVGEAAGMAIHESQSLLIEMQVSRSREFMEFIAPSIRKHLGPFTKNPESLETENLVALVTRVKPDFIRVDADEVTYPAHIILRFQLERALIEGSLLPEDLPSAWNEKMQSYLGLSTTGNDRDGCLQDVHWFSGDFGYFPAYTFGAVIAAQFFNKISKDVPSAKNDILTGNFAGIRNWLKEKVWSQGRRLDTLTLVKEASGQNLSVKSFKEHLVSRYLD